MRQVPLRPTMEVHKPSRKTFLLAMASLQFARNGQGSAHFYLGNEPSITAGNNGPLRKKPSSWVMSSFDPAGQLPAVLGKRMPGCDGFRQGKRAVLQP